MKDIVVLQDLAGVHGVIDAVVLLICVLAMLLMLDSAKDIFSADRNVIKRGMGYWLYLMFSIFHMPSYNQNGKKNIRHFVIKVLSSFLILGFAVLLSQLKKLYS